ncbi:MAG TPA: DUF2892 domain-containing protein [Flavobacteriaceae bacterium]|nr:DUF2892 domain-containing protein [Flavobacteriaceae bacterium]
MTRERYIRLFAGAMILISAFLAYFVNINWIWLAVFVGANLFQFAITQWCLLNSILKSFGVKSELECAAKVKTK